MQGMGRVLEIEMIHTGNISGADISGNPVVSVLFLLFAILTFADFY